MHMSGIGLNDERGGRGAVVLPAGPGEPLPLAESLLGRNRPLAGGSIRPRPRCSRVGHRAARAPPQGSEEPLDLEDTHLF